MAGDWIPWCKGLSRKPEVLAIAKATGQNRRWVAAALMEFWEWVDEQTEDGKIPATNLADLCDFVGGTSETFWLTMVTVNWLAISADGITIPKFQVWLGRSAKRRLRNSQQKKDERSRPSSSKDDKTTTTGQDRTGQRVKNPSSAEKPREKKAPTPREPDALFDAIAKVTSSDPKVSAANIGRVKKLLLQGDPPYTPEEVLRLPDVWADKGWKFDITLGSVQKHIGLVRQQKPPAPPTPDTTAEMMASRQESERLAKQKFVPPHLRPPPEPPKEDAVEF